MVVDEDPPLTVDLPVDGDSPLTVDPPVDEDSPLTVDPPVDEDPPLTVDPPEDEDPPVDICWFSEEELIGVAKKQRQSLNEDCVNIKNQQM